MYYNVDYEICAIIFLLLLIVLSSTKRRLENFQTKMFRVYIAGTFLSVSLNVITCYTDTYFYIVPVAVNYLLNAVFLSLQCMIPSIFLLYVYHRVQKVNGQQNWFIRVMFAPALIGVFLIVTSVWTRYIFYFDSSGYHHGILHDYLYVNAVVYAVGTIIYTIIFEKVLKRTQCVTICAMIVVTLAPTVVQYFLPSYMLSGVGTAISVFIMYMTSENLVVYLDSVTGALNREALAYHINDSKRRGMPEQIFVIALDNFKIVNEQHGMEGGNQIMWQLVAALQKEYSDSRVFRFGGDTFVIVLEEKTEGIKELDRIRRILRRSWMVRNTEVELSACICLIHSIHHSDEELLRAIEYSVSKAKSIGKRQFFEVDEEAVAEMERRAAIEQAMMASIENDVFEVHYQPIFDTNTGRFHSMEALARLNVPGYGYVSPEEFIRIAEQNGAILQIGILVLKEVCLFIKQFHLKEKGIEFIEVNLSVVQCMQEKICAELMQVLREYNIPPEMINLEITESVAAYSEKRLIQNMARLSLYDITFSLDDYGSGYSNVSYLVDLPFSIVKLDKYIVWAAMKKVTSRKILENTIAMFKDINLKIVAEGIEDLEMVQMLTSMGADYLQGYFFSKPVPKEKLLECLEEGYLEELYKKHT